MLELLPLNLRLVRRMLKRNGFSFVISFLSEKYFTASRGCCAMMSNVKVERGVMGVLRRWAGVSPNTIVNLLTGKHKLHNRIRNTRVEELINDIRSFFISDTVFYFPVASYFCEIV
jgi:hypothetical protein